VAKHNKSLVFAQFSVAIFDKQVLNYAYEPPAPKTGKYLGSGEIMSSKFVLAFCILALAAAIAGNNPVKSPIAHVTLSQPAVVNGTALKAGDYRLIINEGKVTFSIDKESREIPAKVETGQKKYDVNQVQYDVVGTQITISQICLGGTKTRLVFN
jgi:hypothetical protein